MKIVAITRILNESDIIEAFVRHTASSVDHHYIMDNGSHDGTVSILEALAKEGIPLTLYQSRSVTYNEADSVTFLYKEACKTLNPGWILCFDCDEFIDDRRLNGGLRGYLSEIQHRDINCIALPMVAYVCSETDNDAEQIVPKRITRRFDGPKHSLGKVLVRASLDFNFIQIENGSHFVKYHGKRLESISNPELCLAHYAERSAYQYFSKVIRGWSKVLASGTAELERKTATHYKGAYEKLKWNPDIFIRDKNFMDFKKNSQNFIEDPIDYRGGALKYTPRNDELIRSIKSLMGFLEHCVLQHGRILDQFPEVRKEVEKWESKSIKIV